MSINGINSNPLLANIGPLARPDQTSQTQTDRNRTSGGVGTTTAPATAPALRPQAPIAGQSTQTAVPAEAPAGTDSALWSVLTSEERNFFAKTASLGPLTYGRIKAAVPANPPSVRGGRLDVRA
ncbi:MAG: hypothetical protein ACO1Q7_14825 [Gemmatimonas sp.]